MLGTRGEGEEALLVVRGQTGIWGRRGGRCAAVLFQSEETDAVRMDRPVWTAGWGARRRARTELCGLSGQAGRVLGERDISGRDGRWEGEGRTEEGARGARLSLGGQHTHAEKGHGHLLSLSDPVENEARRPGSGTRLSSTLVPRHVTVRRACPRLPRAFLANRGWSLVPRDSSGASNQRPRSTPSPGRLLPHAASA